MTEDFARKLYKIPYAVPDPVQDFSFDMPDIDQDDDAATQATGEGEDDDAPKVKVQANRKPKKKMLDVPVPEGLIGEAVFLLLEHEEIKALAMKKQKPYNTLLTTADDWLRMRVGPVKYDDAVEYAPYWYSANAKISYYIIFYETVTQ